MDMINCPRCGTRFDPELLICPVCKAEVIPPKPKEQKEQKVKRPPLVPALNMPALPDPTAHMHIVERPAVDGAMTGAIWSDVLIGLTGGLALPGLVGWSVFSMLSEIQFSYLLAFLFLALPVGLQIWLFIYVLKRYRFFAIGLAITTFLCVLALCGIGLLFAGSALATTFRSMGAISL